MKTNSQSFGISVSTSSMSYLQFTHFSPMLLLPLQLNTVTLTEISKAGDNLETPVLGNSKQRQIYNAGYFENNAIIYRSAVTERFVLKANPFVAFFLRNNINQPKCFKKSNSLARANNKYLLLKFKKLLLRKGLGISASKWMFEAILNLVDGECSAKQNELTHPWILAAYLLSINSNSEHKQKQNTISWNSATQFSTHTALTQKGKSYSLESGRFDSFITRLQKPQVLFKLSFNRVDKRIRKFSRGKIGKYQCALQYVPAFRRKYATLHWLLDEINFSPEIRWVDRIENIVSSLYDDQNTQEIEIFNLRLLKLATKKTRNLFFKKGAFRARIK